MQGFEVFDMSLERHEFNFSPSHILTHTHNTQLYNIHVAGSSSNRLSQCACNLKNLPLVLLCWACGKRIFFHLPLCSSASSLSFLPYHCQANAVPSKALANKTVDIEVNFNTWTFSTFQANGAFWMLCSFCLHRSIQTIHLFVIICSFRVCGRRCHQIRYAHEKLNIYHATESSKTIKKKEITRTNDRTKERMTIENKRRILLQIAYIEGRDQNV